MARKRKDEDERSPKTKGYADKVKKVRERTKAMMDADDSTNRDPAMDDIKFVHVPESQWEDSVKKARGKRPCPEFNKLRVTIKRVVNDIRANRPQIKIRASEDGDRDTAETLEGLVRNICVASDMDTITDTAAEYQVAAGLGAWRVNVDYVSDGVFEQEIVIEQIRNPFNLYWDNSCQDQMKRDARDWSLISRIPTSEYERRWPNAEVASFESDAKFDDEADWAEDADKTVRICEYWYKEPVTKQLLLWDDGKVTDGADVESGQAQMASGSQVVKQRHVKSHKIAMCIASGNAILEEAEWAGSMFPFVVVHGEEVIIDGKTYWFGLTRFAKDAQRSYNYSRAAAIETVALAPQAKYWASPAMAENHTAQWIEAHAKGYPWLIANPDPKFPGQFPARMGGADVPVALNEQIMLASEDIKGVTGIFDNSLGKQGNETSGRAIMARQEQGEIAVFNYKDNIGKGIQRTGEILVDLIPKIYDTQRSLRILGIDLSEKYVEVNEVSQDPQTGELIKVNDVSKGKYDVTVTVGPSFATRRLETADMLMQLAQGNEQFSLLFGDLILQSMDFVYADKAAKRAQTLLPPAVQALEAEGQELPPEVVQAKAQVEQGMAQLEQTAALIQEEAAKVEQGKAGLTKQAAQLDVKLAQIREQIATANADLTKREAELVLKEAHQIANQKQEGVDGEREAFEGEKQAAMQGIQEQVTSWITEASGVIAEIVKASNAPKKKRVTTKKVQGGFVSEVEESAA